MNWSDKIMFWCLNAVTGGEGICIYFSFMLILVYSLFALGGWIGFIAGSVILLICLFFAKRTVTAIFNFSSWYVKLSGLFK